MLTPQEKGIISKEFDAAGLDGNGRFEVARDSLRIISDILAEHGLLADFFPVQHTDMHGVHEGEGKANFTLMRSLDDFHREDEAISIDNSMLVFSWHYTNFGTNHPDQPGQAEVLVYLS